MTTMTIKELADWAIEKGQGWHKLPTLDSRNCAAFCACHNLGLIKIDTTSSDRFYVRVENCERYLNA